MREASIFLDESGSDGLRDRHYILAIVVHDQADDIQHNIRLYEQALREKGLPDIPFHASPLLNGHGAYDGLDLQSRKKLLSAFRVFFRHTSIQYHCVKLKPSEYDSVDSLIAAMRKCVVDFVFSQLEFFQNFDVVKVYYDGGQKSVAEAVRKALDYALAKDSIVYRASSYEDYRLSQIADYLCTMELTALKYEDKTSTATDEKFFGSWRQFKKSFFKEIVSKRFA